MSVGIFTWLLQYFPKNRAILVQKLWGEKKLSTSVFGYFNTKKNSNKKKFRWPLSSRGGGKALVARPLVDELFFAASLIHLSVKIWNIIFCSSVNVFFYVHSLIDWETILDVYIVSFFIDLVNKSVWSVAKNGELTWIFSLASWLCLFLIRDYVRTYYAVPHFMKRWV